MGANKKIRREEKVMAQIIKIIAKKSTLHSAQCTGDKLKINGDFLLHKSVIQSDVENEYLFAYC